MQYFYDTNPATPYTIYNDVYFKSKTGDWYVEYIAYDGSGWYMYYSIEAEEGVFFQPGEELWYEIGLYSFGPSLYKWTSPRALIQEQSSQESEATSRLIINDTPTNRIKSEIIGTQEKKIGNGIIKIKYGRLDQQY